MKKQPLLLMLICYILGIFFYEFFPISLSQMIILIVLAIVLVVFSFVKAKISQKPKIYFFSFLFITIGAFSHFLHSAKPEIPKFDGIQIVIFQLDKKLNSNKKYRKYEVSAHIEEKEINLILYIPKDKQPLDFKNFYQTKAYLNKVEKPNNNFQFDYAKYLSRKGIYYQSFVTGEVLKSPKSALTLTEKIKQKRLEVLNNIDESKLPKKEREFLKGIILADRTEMDTEMISDFSKSGLVHFLAISGTHLAIIFWLILYLLKPIFTAKYRKIPIVLSLILIWSFTFFIDGGSSVFRSCLMISAYYSFILLERKPDLLHAISIAGFSILIFDTHQVFDVGFQLSFVAVLGIFWLNEPILRLFPTSRNKVQEFLWNIISVSLTAQIVTLPLVIFYFHQYSFLSIVANILIIPFSEIIIVFSFLMTILFSFDLEFLWLNYLYEKIVSFLLESIHYFAEQDWFFIKNIPLTIVEVIILFVVIFHLRSLFLKESRGLVRFLGILLLFFGVRSLIQFYTYYKNEVIIVNYFDQKIIIQKDQGNAVFWVEKSIDDKSLKSFIIEPYVTSRQIQKIEIKKVSGKINNVKIQPQILR